MKIKNIKDIAFSERKKNTKNCSYTKLLQAKYLIYVQKILNPNKVY